MRADPRIRAATLRDMESRTQWLPAPPSPAAEPPVPFVYEPGPVQPDDTKGQDGRSQSWLRRKLGAAGAAIAAVLAKLKLLLLVLPKLKLLITFGSMLVWV